MSELGKVGDVGFRFRPGRDSVWYRFLYNGCSLVKIPEETEDNNEWNKQLIHSIDLDTIDYDRAAWYHNNVPLRRKPRIEPSERPDLIAEWRTFSNDRPGSSK